VNDALPGRPDEQPETGGKHLLLEDAPIRPALQIPFVASRKTEEKDIAIGLVSALVKELDPTLPTKRAGPHPLPDIVENHRETAMRKRDLANKALRRRILLAEIVDAVNCHKHTVNFLVPSNEICLGQGAGLER
jgi:hypothetical protein